MLGNKVFVLIVSGFPRTTVQAKSLDKNVAVHSVINLDVPFDIIKERLCSRWIHLSSGRVYNKDFNPPKIQACVFE